MLAELFSVTFQHWLFVLPLATAAYLLNNRYQRGLSTFSGPFVASPTDWWHLLEVLGWRPDLTQRQLHAKHGDIVRLGPNCLSVTDLKASKTIYGLNQGFVKSEFYPVQQSLSNGARLPSLFFTTNDAFYGQLRRYVNSACSMTALVQYEE